MSYRNFLFINIFIVRELWFFIDEEKKNPFNKYFFFLRNPMMWYIFQMSFRLLLNLIYHSAFIVIELCWRWLFFRAAERPKLFPFFFFFKRLCFAFFVCWVLLDILSMSIFVWKYFKRFIDLFTIYYRARVISTCIHNRYRRREMIMSVILKMIFIMYSIEIFLLP